MYKIQFLNSKSIRENIARPNILKGSVKDYFSPTIHNIGILGNARKKDNIHIYNIWVNLLKRCYIKECPAYKWYGARGVTVCERWKRLDYFTEDIPKIKGYDKDLFKKRNKN